MLIFKNVSSQQHVSKQYRIKFQQILLEKKMFQDILDTISENQHFSKGTF